jgi:2-dehydro-3-deoxy-D-arabinonate dehydratase
MARAIPLPFFRHHDMQLVKFLSGDQPAVGKLESGKLLQLDLASRGLRSLSDILFADNPASLAAQLPVIGSPMSLDAIKALPPIDHQEVWAAGVTYKRSQTARMEESEAAKDCYDRVYNADRPEIFFKATPSRCSGHGGDLRIRTDATWNVPEPELALVLSPKAKIVGFTIGNDMSSRDIEGDNPLYLPQAKVYNQCCGLGPCITLVEAMPDLMSVQIRLSVIRGGAEVFGGETSVTQMKRNVHDLVKWLYHDNDMPSGAFLLTGTGIVPDSSFTLAPNDQVNISIDGIGTLSNRIVQG